MLEGSAIEYMALQELFPVGSVVVTNGLGGLGGTLVALRVEEAYYEPQVHLLQMPGPRHVGPSRMFC